MTLVTAPCAIVLPSILDADIIRIFCTIIPDAPVKNIELANNKVGKFFFLINCLKTLIIY